MNDPRLNDPRLNDPTGSGARTDGGARNDARHVARYGVDGPGWLLGLTAAALAPLAAVAAGGPRRLLRCTPVPAVAAGLFLHATARGKFRVWEEQLDALGLRGDERALDLGCGRGALLTAVARRLPRGRVTGVDLWRRVDQSGNGPGAALDNARRTGVADRIDLVTADMRRLPLDDEHYDVVVSGLAIHNIPDREGRRQAVREAYRVLKPGGRLLVLDLFHTADYRRTLLAAGAVDVTRTDVGPRMWWSGPWIPTRALGARKPVPTHGLDRTDRKAS
ncbi:class I SAM-dependent methyltransferase [Streptomyces sp. NPDC018693]|uniref:class I SAM-dependent methyltransferase n=1 Tax=unclassified Streptomyces TaxID=2593676 RepID=UPI00378E9CBB